MGATGRLVSVLAFLFAAAALALVVIHWVTPLPESFSTEIAKGVIQIGMVAAGGAVLSALVFRYQQEIQRERQRLEYREELLKATLGRTMAGYKATKRARRLLRALAIRQDPSSGELLVLSKPYDQYMMLLNDAQLDFEDLARDVETSQRAFSSPRELVEALRSMEKVLGEVVGEFEASRKTFEGDPEKAELRHLPVLGDLIGKTRGSQFEARCVHPYHEVQRRIRADLLHPQLPAGSVQPG